MNEIIRHIVKLDYIQSHTVFQNSEAWRTEENEKERDRNTNTQSSLSHEVNPVEHDCILEVNHLAGPCLCSHLGHMHHCHAVRLKKTAMVVGDAMSIAHLLHHSGELSQTVARNSGKQMMHHLHKERHKK